MNRVEIQVWPHGGGLICHDQECKFRKECANHSSAGDFRSEDGFTPELTLNGGEFYCDTKYRPFYKSGWHKIYSDKPDNYFELSFGMLCRHDLVDEMDNVAQSPLGLA